MVEEEEPPPAKVGEGGGKRSANQMMGSQQQQNNYYPPGHGGYLQQQQNYYNYSSHTSILQQPAVTTPGNQPLLLPSKRQEKHVITPKTPIERPKLPPQCNVCVLNNGIYSDHCPGKYKQSNCSFFNQNGSRKQCTGCDNKKCDGGNELQHRRCRFNNGMDVRMCEVLQHCSSEPLPPPPPLNIRFPSNTSCIWSQDSDARIITADFRGLKRHSVCKADFECLLSLFELTDAVVVSIGLAKETLLSSNTGSSPDEYHHIITTLRKAEEYKFVKDVALIANVNQFIVGGKVRPNNEHTLESFLKYHENSQGLSESKLTCKNDGSEECLYLIDYPLVTFPKLQDDFMRKFIIPDILPGGAECLMSCVSIHCIIFCIPTCL